LYIIKTPFVRLKKVPLQVTAGPQCPHELNKQYKHGDKESYSVTRTNQITRHKLTIYP
jgi:hypothetical protein